MDVLGQIGLVALGSAGGGLARWGLGLALARPLGAAFPYPTLLINVSGSLFLGWFAAVLDRKLAPLVGLDRDGLHLLLAVGFTGAYTTFSTFELEAHRLLTTGRGLAGTAYLLLSLGLGLLAVQLGAALGRWQLGENP